MWLTRTLRMPRRRRRNRTSSVLRGRCALPGQDLGEPVDVDLGELPLPLPKPRDQLGPQDVDLPVQDPAPVGDLVLLLLQPLDHGSQVVVVELGQIRELFQDGPSWSWWRPWFH